MLESVIVLRHALAGNRAEWVGDDLTRPLDVDGLNDSLALVDALASWPIDEIWTSPAVRCQHTVAALAADRRVPVRTADWLLVGTSRDTIGTALDHTAPSVLLCSHRELIPDLLDALGPLPLPTPSELAKGAALAVRFEDGIATAAEEIHPSLPLSIA